MSDRHSEKITDAFGFGDLKLVRDLVASNPEVLEPDANNFNRLHQCFYTNGIRESEDPLAYVAFLVEIGVDVNGKADGTNTPLFYAVRSGVNSEVVKLLLELGADPNAKCENGRTPLREAFVKKPLKWELAELMINAGGDAHEPNEHGKTVAGYATRRAEESDKHWLKIFE